MIRTIDRRNTGHPLPEAVETAVGRHMHCMFATALRIVRSEDLAWDAVQDTLVRLLEGKIVSPYSRGTLVQMTKLCSLQILRGHRRREAHESRTPQPRSPEEAETQFERAELIGMLDRAVSGLGALAGQLMRRRIEGASYEEIAKELDLPVGTVRSRLNRARRLLFERLSRCPTCSDLLRVEETPVLEECCQ